MDMNKIRRFAAQYWIPGLMTLLGLILTVNPDSAAVLASKLIGLALIVQGVVQAFSIVREVPGASNPTRWILVAACIVLGAVLSRSPMLLAQMIFRLLGVVLLVRAIADLRLAKDLAVGAKTVSMITLVCGAVLVLVPVVAYRLAGRVLGIVVLVIGVLNIVSRHRSAKRLEHGSKPNIIDAE